MDDTRLIQSLKNIPKYFSVMKKLTVNPKSLSEDEKIYILTCAIILIKKYEKDTRFKSYVELAYYIILKYSLSFNDFEPLYDFSVNIGFYPIAYAIIEKNYINFKNINFSLIPSQIISKYKQNEIIETLDQNLIRNKILDCKNNELSFIAPTSFGKSSIIINHIISNCTTAKKFAIIVPTKSLLMQMYRDIRKEKLNMKILIHDEMFDDENRFIGIFTQERALRLLDKKDVFFDILYIDEAHHLLERNSRSILLSRLIKLNYSKNVHTKIVYLSPLIAKTDNLKIFPYQNIFEHRITFNIKEPEYYEFRRTGEIYKYNRFVNDFFEIGNCKNLFKYIHKYKKMKNFCYLYTPKKIEQFAEELYNTCYKVDNIDSIQEIIINLKKYVHPEFYVIKYLEKGIIYLHGKMPDVIKEYLEYKFKQIPEIHFLIANKVVLEGVNLPIDSLFILDGTNLNNKELINLMGRVNRLDQIFGNINDLSKLMPKIHFVNNDKFYRKNAELKNKIELLKSSRFDDKIQNPILDKFDYENIGEKEKDICNEIIKNEEIFFSNQNTPVQILKQKMISLGMNSIYEISNDLCEKILRKINIAMQNVCELRKVHFLDKLQNIFIKEVESSIKDKEFKRLKHDNAIEFYKMFFNNRKSSLKDNIIRTVKYYESRRYSQNSLLYVGESYGETQYYDDYYGKYIGNKVYVDLRKKTFQQMVNIAIIKQKIEEDFVNYKLNMFFKLMLDYELLTIEEYQDIIYGTTDIKKMKLIKIGLPINIINRLENDKQIENIKIDNNNILYTNDKFDKYKQNLDDFYRFELSKYL